MRLLDRQVWIELSEPFFFGVAAFTSIFFAGSQLQKLTNYMLKGLSLLTATELVILVLPGIIVLTLPMATLLAILQGFGRLSSDSEIVALYSSGVSLRRIAVPVIILGLLVSIASFVLNEAVVPAANRLYDGLVADVLKEPLKSKQALSFVETDGEVTTQVLVFGGINVRDGIMRDVAVTQYRKNKPFVMFTAKKAVRDEKSDNKWTLHDGWLKYLQPQMKADIKFSDLETQEIKIHRPAEEIALEGLEPENMSAGQLTSLIRAKKPIGADTSRLEVGLYNKFSLQLASLVFAMIGLPLGIRPHRSGSGYGMGLSVVVILAYWLVWHYMTALANQGSLPPMVGAFTADILGICGAAALLARVAK